VTTQGRNNIVYIMTVSDLLEQFLATSIIISTRLLQVVNMQFIPNLLTTSDKQCEDNLLTTCWQTWYSIRCELFACVSHRATDENLF
jgi:hypothetical protein